MEQYDTLKNELNANISAYFETDDLLFLARAVSISRQIFLLEDFDEKWYNENKS